jgi:hypothetical protein
MATGGLTSDLRQPYRIEAIGNQAVMGTSKPARRGIQWQCLCPDAAVKRVSPHAHYSIIARRADPNNLSLQTRVVPGRHLGERVERSW